MIYAKTLNSVLFPDFLFFQIIQNKLVFLTKTKYIVYNINGALEDIKDFNIKDSFFPSNKLYELLVPKYSAKKVGRFDVIVNKEIGSYLLHNSGLYVNNIHKVIINNDNIYALCDYKVMKKNIIQGTGFVHINNKISLSDYKENNKIIICDKECPLAEGNSLPNCYTHYNNFRFTPDTVLCKLCLDIYIIFDKIQKKIVILGEQNKLNNYSFV